MYSGTSPAHSTQDRNSLGRLGNGGCRAEVVKHPGALHAGRKGKGEPGVARLDCGLGWSLCSLQTKSNGQIHFYAYWNTFFSGAR